MTTATQTKTPISTVQKQKLLELEMILRGGDELQARARLNTAFRDAYQCTLESASYEQGARMTGTLLTELRNATHAPTPQPPAPGAPTAPAPVIPTPTPTETPTPAPSPLPFAEAPFSWNTRATDANGWTEQFTIRAHSGKELFDNVALVKAKLAKEQYKPANERGGGTQAGTSNNAGSAPGAEEIPLCAIHKTPLAKRQGKNGSFWSCPQRLDTGEFCPYRPKS